MSGPPRAEVASAALLVLAGSSLGLGLATAALAGPELAAFVARNELAAEARGGLLLALAGGGALGAAVAALLRFAGDARALDRAAALAAPLALFAFVPLVRPAGHWSERPLVFLALLSVSVLALEAGLAGRTLPAIAASAGGRLPSIRLSAALGERLALALVALSAFGYAVFAGVFTIFRHWRFESRGFDLGIQANLMWRALHGEPFRSTVVLPDGTSFLSHHAELTSLLYLPVYALAPGAENLLVFQAVALGAAAIPLYGFASTLLPRGPSVAIALAYLLYAPMHGPSFYDFHWLPISIPLCFGLFWALAAERTGTAWILVALLLGIREDVALGLAGLGAFLVLAGVRARFGVALVAVASAWFLAIKFVVMASAGPSPFPVIHGGLGSADAPGYLGVLASVLSNPAFTVATLLDERKLVYVLHLFAPLAFLPLRRLAYLPLFLAGFLVTLLTTGYGPTVSIAFQYTAHWIPYLFGALVLELRRRGETPARAAAALAVAAGVVAHSYVFGAVLQKRTFVGGFDPVAFSFETADAERLDRFRRIAERIPPEASVAATEFEVPHLSARREVYTLGLANPGADYVLVALDHLEPGLTRPLFEQVTNGGAYRLIAREQELVLFERLPSPADREQFPQELR